MELIIKRSEWLRGEGASKSYLLRDDDGMKCCLGFYSLACGLTEEQIRNKDTVAALQLETACALPETLMWLIGGARWNSEVAISLMDVNDDETKSDVEREAFIIEEFAKHGVTVRFED